LDEGASVGRSSAQAEILLARLYIAQQQFALGEQMMGIAEKMVADTHSAYDEACLFLAKGEFFGARASMRPGDRADLQRATESFETAINRFAETGTGDWRYAEDQLRRLRAGRPLASPWADD
jgi:hypothetical protein